MPITPLPLDWAQWDSARLSAELAAHNRRYWDENDPSISDYDYDRLVERLRTLDPSAPILDALGPTIDGELGDAVEHDRPMLSLDKAYDEEALRKWAAKFTGDLVMTPKVDGVACSIRYTPDGRLQVAATRGSGTVGEDITANVRRIIDVPETIAAVGDPVEVRGEVYMPRSTFARFAGQFANPRNTAAGALKQKDSDRSARMGLRFFAYDVVGAPVDREVDKLAMAAQWGFSPVECRVVNIDEVQSGYEEYVSRRDDLDFEIDGVVFKANRIDEQRRLGATAHHPRYAIAYKLQGESAGTVLREVEWSVSRTGALTPVGIVEPVLLSGAMVTRISLHNWGLVQAKALSLGAKVVAMRRGGVIPYLEAMVEPGHTPITPPEACPSCRAPAVVDGDQVECRNRMGCPAQSIGILGHYAKIAGIEGFGQVWLETLVAARVLGSPVDFYRLRAKDLMPFDRMGETLAQKLVEQVDATRTMPLGVFLQALGIPDLGKTAAQTMATHYGTLEAVRNAAPIDVVELPKFGELLAQRVVAGIRDRAELIDGLLEHITVQSAEPPAADAGEGPLSGRSFLFTATLAAMKRSEAQEKVKALGGAAASGVSKALTYLVVGSEGRAGSKLTKAQKLGVTVLSEADFIALVADAEA